MARYIGPVCKLCRREATKLFLKGERCYSKCPIDKPTGIFAPGQHGRRRSKLTEYGKRLREKQKAKRMAGMLENQFFRFFEQARQTPGKTGEVLLRMLETRLDNVVRRLGFSSSISGARQLVLHGHVKVNGKRVDISSFNVKVGDVITVSDKLKGSVVVQRALSNRISREVPGWLELNPQIVDTLGRSKDLPIDLGEAKLEGKVRFEPKREEMSFPVNEQYIIELYSK
jgi:small subunit ribosomal protein S4